VIGGVDFSKYQAGATVDAIREAVQAQGPLVTVQLFRNDGPNEFAGHQLYASKQAGATDLAGYVLLNWESGDWPGQVQVDMALTVVSPVLDVRELLFVALDVETYPGWDQSDVAYRIPRLLEAIDHVRSHSLYPIVYTNKGMWETVMSGTPQDWGVVVNQTEIWMATMDAIPDFGNAVKAQPWNPVQIVAEQYEANSWGGFDFDQNVWSDSFVAARRAERDARLHPAPPPPPPPPPPPADPCADLRTKLEQIRQIAS